LSSGIPLSDIDLSDAERADLVLDTDPTRHISYYLRNFSFRQLFLTKHGRLGFTLRGVKQGDVVCVFDGAPTPHVLSKVSAVNDPMQRWRFVGDAYVHGLMNCEADAMDIEVRNIVLE
jgi:hypothetical protein